MAIRTGFREDYKEWAECWPKKKNSMPKRDPRMNKVRRKTAWGWGGGYVQVTTGSFPVWFLKQIYKGK